MFMVNPYRFGAAAPTDPNYANVSLLLHMDGTNGSTTFTDQKGNHTITAVGNAQISTSSPKFGTGAVISDGTGDYLKTGALSSSGTLDLSAAVFTIEAWIYRTSTGVNQVICSWGASYPSDYGGEMYIDSSDKLRIGINALTVVAIGSTNVPSNQWVHVAATWDGSTYRVFVNGTMDGSGSNGAGPDFKTSQFNIFGNPVYGIWPNGSMMDDFRVTKGVCRYTSSFTPPTAAFPNS